MNLMRRMLIGIIAAAMVLASPLSAYAQDPSPASTDAPVSETSSTSSDEASPVSPGDAIASAAAEASPDNAAVAINDEDGTSIFEFAFDVVQTTSDVVDQTNLALAFSNCEDCRTVAVAIQLVFVVGSPSTVTPENVALAINYDCTLCETVALAYQFVIGVGDESVGFTEDGEDRLDDLQEQMQELWEKDLTAEEFIAEFGLLADELSNILAEELVAGDEDGDDEDDEDDDEQDDDDDEQDEDDAEGGSDTTPSIAPSSSPSTDTGIESSPSAEPSAEASATP